MKILYTIVIMLFIVGCSKEQDPIVPINNASVSSTSCATSTWRYEVDLGSPVVAGTFKLDYRDEYNNVITDTIITSTWSKSFTPQYTGLIYTQMIISPGPVAINSSTNTMNTVKITIYKDGNIVQTTGVFVDYCYGFNPACNAPYIISKQHQCSE